MTDFKLKQKAVRYFKENKERLQGIVEAKRRVFEPFKERGIPPMGYLHIPVCIRTEYDIDCLVYDFGEQRFSHFLLGDRDDTRIEIDSDFE